MKYLATLALLFAVSVYGFARGGIFPVAGKVIKISAKTSAKGAVKVAHGAKRAAFGKSAKAPKKH